MTRWALIKRDGLYHWRGQSCWGGAADERGGWPSREDALKYKPLTFGDRWDDLTGDDHA